MPYTFVLLGTFLMLPIIAFAATGDILKDAVRSWENIEQQHILDEKRDLEQESDESSPELFPEVESVPSKGTIDAQRSSRISGYVSAFIEGETVTFSDVPRDTWFAPYIRDIAAQGIVSGYRDADGKALGLFGSADHVTIEQLAKIALASSLNLGECPSTPPLNLTASGSWSASYIACTEKLQWTMYGDGGVDVHRDATRSEVVVTLLEAFHATIQESTGSGSVFTDVTPSTLFNPFIAKAKRDGIVSGYTDIDGNPTGLFGPADPVTRAELSKMVVLAMQVYSKK